MSQAIKTLPAVTVGTTPVQADQRGQNFHKWASVRVQADTNNSGKIYVGGTSSVSATQNAATLIAGDYYVVQGGAVDPTRVWLVASAAGQVVEVSGT